MIIPILLDLFLWVGPRLEAGALYQQLAPSFQSMAADADVSTQQATQEVSAAVQDFLAKYNMFSWLTAGLFGVPSLNVGIDATAKTLTGSVPPAWQVTDFNTYFVLILTLSAIGLLLAGLFWAMLCDQLRGAAFEFSDVVRNGVAIWIKLLAFVLGVVVAALLLLVPMSFLTLVVGAFSVGLASLVPALALSLLFWGVFYLIFTVHGLALYQMTLRQAIRISSLIVRIYFAPTLGLIVLSVAIYIGLGLIWDSFAIDSVLRLVAIVGNALIATALFMASLIYYQSRASILLDYLKAAQSPTASQV